MEDKYDERERCGSCRFYYQPVKWVEAECHFLPPILDNDFWKRPTVYSPDVACSKFEPVEPVEPKASPES